MRGLALWLSGLSFQSSSLLMANIFSEKNLRNDHSGWFWFLFLLGKAWKSLVMNIWWWWAVYGNTSASLSKVRLHRIISIKTILKDSMFVWNEAKPYVKFFSLLFVDQWCILDSDGLFWSFSWNFKLNWHFLFDWFLCDMKHSQIEIFLERLRRR